MRDSQTPYLRTAYDPMKTTLLLLAELLLFGLGCTFSLLFASSVIAFWTTGIRSVVDAGIMLVFPLVTAAVTYGFLRADAAVARIRLRCYISKGRTNHPR